MKERGNLEQVFFKNRVQALRLTSKTRQKTRGTIWMRTKGYMPTFGEQFLKGSCSISTRQNM